jgi:methionyl-tRNA formyltransferase
MRLDEGLDTGPLLLSERTPIGPEETAAELSPRLGDLGARLLVATLRGIEEGRLTPVPQDEERATLARLLVKEDGRLDLARPAAELAARVRGFHPWPGTFVGLDGRTLKVLAARAEDGAAGAPPGTILAIDGEGILVACGGSSRLRLLSVQPESRKAMPAAAFAAGARLAVGARLV